MSEQELIRSIGALEESERAEDAVALLSRISVAKDRMRDLDKMVKEAVIEFIDRTGLEPTTLDGKRYYVGIVKRTKCNDTRAALEALLNATGGDLDAIAECLSSNALKPGACRKSLDGTWDDHFTVTESPDLKTGKAKRTLQLADDRYSAR